MLLLLYLQGPGRLQAPTQEGTWEGPPKAGTRAEGKTHPRSRHCPHTHEWVVP